VRDRAQEARRGELITGAWQREDRALEDMKAGIVTDRYVRLKDFLDNLYNVDGLAPRCVSDQAWQASFNVAAGSGAHAI
jgi:hypothetical protein